MFFATISPFLWMYTFSIDYFCFCWCNSNFYMHPQSWHTINDSSFITHIGEWHVMHRDSWESLWLIKSLFLAILKILFLSLIFFLSWCLELSLNYHSSMSLCYVISLAGFFSCIECINVLVFIQKISGGNTVVWLCLFQSCLFL